MNAAERQYGERCENHHSAAICTFGCGERVVRPGALEAGSAAPLAERVSWAIDNRARLPAMGERGRERATVFYAAERNYPQLLDTLAEVVQKPVRAG
jgi:hypothetical protein